MRETATPGHDVMSIEEDCLVIAMDDSRNRDLLVDWLDSLPRYRVLTATEPADLPDEYDLCLVTAALFEEFRAELTARSNVSGSVYLPHVLAVPEADVDDVHYAKVTESGSPINDVVALPIGKARLRRRLENLLQTRRASRSLAEREQQYRQLVELTPETILIVDEDDIVYANEAAESLFGTDDPATVEDHNLSSFVVSDDTPRLETLLAAIESAGDSAPEFVELEIQTVGGETRVVEVTGVELVYDDQSMIQLVIRDLTEKKAREQQLTLFERAIETASQGITIADARQEDLPLIYANEGFEQITGYSVDEIIGRNCRFLQGPNTDPETVAEIRRALESEEPVVVDILNYRKDGTPFWNRLDIVPVQKDGEVTHFLGLQQDVTTEKEQAQQLSVLNRVLRHNLRNKMNVIQAYADQLTSVDGATDAADAIATAADELLTISEQIQEFGSLVSVDERDLDRIDLVSAVEEVLSAPGTSEDDTTVELTAPESASVLAHPTLRAALTAVFELATSVDDPELTVDITASDDEVMLEVLDRGQSFRQEDLDIVAGEMETPLEHLQTLELWLIRWAVEESSGEFTVDTSGSDSVIRMRFFSDAKNISK